MHGRWIEFSISEEAVSVQWEHLSIKLDQLDRIPGSQEWRKESQKEVKGRQGTYTLLLKKWNKSPKFMFTFILVKMRRHRTWAGFASNMFPQFQLIIPLWGSATEGARKLPAFLPLTTNRQFGLQPSSPGHLLIGFLCHSEDVRVHVAHVLATVGVDDILSIDWQLFIRIDGNKHNTYKQMRQSESGSTAATWLKGPQFHTPKYRTGE